MEIKMVIEMGRKVQVRVVRCVLPAAQRIACIASRHHTPYPCLDLCSSSQRLNLDPDANE